MNWGLAPRDDTQPRRGRGSERPDSGQASGAVANVGQGQPGRIDIERAGDDVLFVSLIGEHDMDTAPGIETAIAAARTEGRGVVVDLVETTFIDSSVIHVLGRASQAMPGRVALRLGEARVVRTALELTSMLTVIPSAESQQEAIRIVRESR